MSCGAGNSAIEQLYTLRKTVTGLTQRVDELSAQIAAFAATYNRTVEAKPEADVKILEEDGS